MIEKYKGTLIEVWKISWPLIIANSFWNIQLTVDRIFLGQYSTETLGAAIAAVGFFWAPMALLQQTAAYVTAFVAQYLGAKKTEWIGPSVWHSIYISLIGGLLFLILVPVSPEVFAWMGHSELLQKLEVEYFQALAFSALPTALVAAASGYFTGIGKSKIIMGINGVGLVLNVFFDYLFISGNWGAPELGIAGAGFATTLSAFGAAFFGFYFVFTSENSKRFNLMKGWRPNLDLSKRFILFGVPAGLSWALEGLAFTVFLAFIGRLPNGDVALSASSITTTFLLLAILPVLGIGQGVAALVGRYLGRDESHQAVKVSWAGWALSTCYIIFFSCALLIFPQFFTGLFASSEATLVWNQVETMVPYLLMFVAFFIFFDNMNIVFSFALKGAGDTRFVSLVSLLLPWPIMVIPSWYVSTWNNGVYWAWAAASVFISLQGLVFLGRFLQGSWKSMRVI